MDKEKFWERQYRRNVGRIIAICYQYVNDRAMAEDLAQDVFVKAMEKFTTTISDTVFLIEDVK
jgi:DNA-directed RNA polymerase specialized sigma24 family protein